MNNQTLGLTHQVMANVFAKLIDGSGRESARVLNPEDRGLLKSLGMLSAAGAGPHPGRAR